MMQTETHPDDVLTEPCPCDDCPNRARCSEQRLACAQFSMFMADQPEKRWRLAPRQPTRELYAAALGERPKGRKRERPPKPTPPPRVAKIYSEPQKLRRKGSSPLLGKGLNEGELSKARTVRAGG